MWLHVPQLEVLVEVSTHDPLQLVVVPPHTSPHTPPAHT
jgi:hypothetical protein